MNAVLDQIKKDITEHSVVLYMKGTEMMPQCGFSARVVFILNELGVNYVTRDVLQDDALRQAIKEYSEWPTLPQLYIDGQFIGGCDIVTEMYESEELKKILSKEVKK